MDVHYEHTKHSRALIIKYIHSYVFKSIHSAVLFAHKESSCTKPFNISYAILASKNITNIFIQNQ